MCAEKNFFSSLLMLAISIIIFIKSFKIETITNNLIGSDFFPKIISIGIFVLSICLLLKSIKSLDISGNKCFKKLNFPKINHHLVLTFILLCLFTFFINTLGFIICTTIYLFFQISLISKSLKKRFLSKMIISVATSLIIYVIFTHGFNIILPSGILG